MMPELVLSQEEKEERFKRYFERKREGKGTERENEQGGKGVGIPIKKVEGGEEDGRMGEEESAGADSEGAIRGEFKQEPQEQNLEEVVSPSVSAPPSLIISGTGSAESPLTYKDIEQILGQIDFAPPGKGASEEETQQRESHSQGQCQHDQQQSQIIQQQQTQRAKNVAVARHTQGKQPQVFGDQHLKQQLHFLQQQQQQQHLQYLQQPHLQQQRPQQQYHVGDQLLQQQQETLQQRVKQEPLDPEHCFSRARGTGSIMIPVSANSPKVKENAKSENLREDWKYQKIVEELRMCEEQCRKAASAASMAATAASQAAAQISSGAAAMSAPTASLSGTVCSSATSQGSVSQLHRKNIITSGAGDKNQSGADVSWDPYQHELLQHQEVQQQQLQMQIQQPHQTWQQQHQHSAFPPPAAPGEGGATSTVDSVSLNYTLFSRACAEAQCLHPDSGPALARRHQRGASLATSADLQETMQLILAQFKCYLSLLPFYQSLCREDQACLLARNSKLYLMFVFGRYFSASSGQEQLQWILGEESPLVKLSSSSGRDMVFLPLQSLSLPGASCFFDVGYFFFLDYISFLHLYTE